MANMERMRVGGFFEPNTREDCAAGFAGSKSVYTDQAGIVRCRKCNKPRMFFLAEARRWLPCACGCKDAYAQEEARALEADRREQSGIIGRYADASFEKTEVTAATQHVYDACLRYAINFGRKQNEGKGVYLYGGNGVGKTHLACCIGNMLLTAGAQVLFATVGTILADIRKAYSQHSDDAAIVDKYVQADLVIFDDIGTEKYISRTDAMTFAQEKFFQIIDGRYVRRKSCVFTSNYTLAQLVSERGVLAKTVDRIDEMSTRKYEVKGTPRRQINIWDSCPF